MPEHWPGESMDLPWHVHGTAPYPQDAWLGITVYAPHVAPAAFALRASRSDTLEDIIKNVKRSGRIPHAKFDAIVPVHPQIHDGYLALLAYPSVIGQSEVPKVAVVIDLTRVGGHCYATILRADITVPDLLRHMRLQVHADYEDEELQFWTEDHALPASKHGALSINHGSLITVMRTPFQPGPPSAASALVAPDTQWGRIDHMPTPPNTRTLALCRGLTLDTVCPHFFPWAQPEDIAKRVFRLTDEHDRVVVIDNDPVLDVQGAPCQQTVIAFTSRIVHGQPAQSQPYYLDPRSFGEAPRLVYVAAPPSQAVDLPHILAEAQVEVPLTFAGALDNNSHYGKLQVMQIGLEVCLAHRIFSTWSHGMTADVPTCSAPEYSTSPAAHGTHTVMPPHTIPAHTGAEPPRFGQTAEAPTAHEMLNLVDYEQIVDAEVQQPPIHSISIPPSCGSAATTESWHGDFYFDANLVPHHAKRMFRHVLL